MTSPYFLAFGRGLSLRSEVARQYSRARQFPRLRAGTFIEAPAQVNRAGKGSRNFPAFGRGLSLRRRRTISPERQLLQFPRLRAGTFIEAYCCTGG